VTTFHADVDQNEYLPRGGTEVNAIVSVTATGASAGDAAAPMRATAAEIIVVDVSGSMDDPPTKIRSARAATETAIDCLRDGVAFAIVAGNHVARELYPGDRSLAISSPSSREQAKASLVDLRPGGGTAISQWLRLAKRLFASYPTDIQHAILLTDGRNEHESEDDLARAINACEGCFVCDCRGVGAGWSVPELHSISSGLLGTVELIREPSEMAADFEATMRSAMSKEINDVKLRVWTPQGARVKYFQLVSTSVEDLTGRRAAVDERTGDYPTPPWGSEMRDYHLCIEVPAREVDEEMLAARVSLVVDEQVLSEAKVRAIWTDDERQSTKAVPRVEQYMDEIERAKAMDEGMKALKAGDLETATSRIQRAVEIAQARHDDESLDLIKLVADIDDHGTVRLKTAVDPLDELEVAVKSRKTNRVQQKN
jgi:hypothetical protein